MEILNRARHLYSDRYIVSDSIKFEFNQMYLKEKEKWVECEQGTRALHFSDMLDSEDTKIFASLSEDGEGGDVTTDGNRASSIVYKDGMFGIKDMYHLTAEMMKDLKVTGIQE